MAEAPAQDMPTLRVAIAGLGTAGCMMLPAVLKHPHLQLTAAADIDAEPLEHFQRDFQVEIHRHVADLCRSPHVDAIYLATPTHLHTEHALTAMQEGKHVVLEKPMALTLDDAEVMIQTAERYGVQLVVGHSHSFERPIRAMREIVRSGELGRLRMLHNWYFTDWMYRPRHAGELDTRLGGGVTFRQGSHQFDIIRMIGGGLVRSVRAMTGVWDAQRPTEGSHVVYLEFEDGTPATAVYSGYDRFHTSELTFGVGEQGQLADLSTYGRSRQALRALPGVEAEVSLKRASAQYGSRRSRQAAGATPHPPFYGITLVSCEYGDLRQSADGLTIYGKHDKRSLPLATDETGRDAVVRELYEAVVHQRPPVHSGRWGKANLEVCLAVLESAQRRQEMLLSHQIAPQD
jgi:phthalate 4,5-cis-dihydrodiol dehydrogenase